MTRPPGTFLGYSVTLEGEDCLDKVSAVSAEGSAQHTDVPGFKIIRRSTRPSNRFGTPEAGMEIIRADGSPVTLEVRQPNEIGAVTFRLYEAPLSIPR